MSLSTDLASRTPGRPALKDLGGWKTEQTVIGTYLQPDQEAQRTALERLTTTGRGAKSE